MTTTNPAAGPLSPELRAAYEAARYEVHIDGGERIVLRHGALHATLDELLRRRHPTARSWAFITAWNPFSERLSKNENDARQRDLCAQLAARGLPTIEGVGRDETSDWHEESLLVVGIDRVEACAFGSRFGQYAVLVGKVGGAAEVCACATSPR